MPRPLRLIGLFLLSLLVLGLARASTPAADPDPGRFVEAIRQIARAQAENPVAPGSIVFLGSSSIRRWDLAAAFPGWPVVNHGFGGSHWSDQRVHLDVVAAPTAPLAYVLYCGENDINSGKPLWRVMADLEVVLDRLRRAEPDAMIILVGAKPSPARAARWPEMQAYNAACADRLARLPNSRFVHPVADFQHPDGSPREDLFVEDRVHLTPAGYAPWERELRPILAELLAASPQG